MRNLSSAPNLGVSPCQLAQSNPAEESQRLSAGSHCQTASDFSHIESKLDRVHLNLDLSDQKQGDTEMQNPVRTVNNSAWQDLKKAEQCYNATHTSQQKRRPWSSSFLDSELVSQAGGLFMSGVTLQSQVCEFCHAVFPGQTSTRGEFLRHLTTHMT
ncbi:uncharacterized protein zgc:113184 isoform X2 [Triplophysa dalaica]|uniref:uncharacterized protein zgc:113184 isoform X2 n=1 Tax=Triplophysa dalaica TaxID=1582913 RepID=UPI0024DF63FE|nr:uncharacterized protein zgc:113184 isoform X2 [Triplophysa dalaica]